MDPSFVPKHYGALLLGAFFASTLSGTVFVQAVIYLRLFHNVDPWSHIGLVSLVCILDFLHTTLIWAAIWHHMVATFGQLDSVTYIYWAISVSVAVTALLTLCVHLFYVNRIWRLSNKNAYITVPIIVIAVLRLASALGTTSQMLRYSTYREFRENIMWIFTLGLALSSGVDVLITVNMFLLLRASQKRATKLVKVLDSLILYGLETGFATCAATIASMLCWVTMQDNLAFLGLHFVISKLYAISMLVMLNTREKLRKAREPPTWFFASTPVIMFDSSGRETSAQPTTDLQPMNTITKRQPLQISVRQNVDVEYDQLSSPVMTYPREPMQAYSSPR